jgi:hypothetical protein
MIELQPLPSSRPLGDVRRRPRPLGGFRLGREVFVEERNELRTEVLDVGVEGELHGHSSLGRGRAGAAAT